MVEFKNILNCFLAFWAGITLSNLILHFRFANGMLRRELVLFMQEGNGYFLTWFYLDLIMFLIFFAVIFIFKKWKKKQK
jgi:hypothetical protein